MNNEEAYPQYESRPVILVHFTVGANTAIAWCAPIKYIPDTGDNYPNIPRVICPACSKAHMR